MKDKANWTWMPHPGHYICGSDCRFILNTCVGEFIVSTVGELYHDNDKEYQDIGLNRKYETMVFSAIPGEHPCCPFIMGSASELECRGYNDAGEAYKGHMAMCEEWCERRAEDVS